MTTLPDSDERDDYPVTERAYDAIRTMFYVAIATVFMTLVLWASTYLSLGRGPMQERQVEVSEVMR